MEERTGEAFICKEPLTVIGKKLQVGDIAPNFSLDYVDLIDMTLCGIQIGESRHTARVLSIVNSLDTPICRLQTQRWETLYSSFPSGILLYTISMDLPHTQIHWQTTEKVAHQFLSAHRNEQFGIEYGILLKEWHLLQRAIFVINCQGRIAYAEYVHDQCSEPDYDRAFQAIMHTAAAS